MRTDRYFIVKWLLLATLFIIGFSLAGKYSDAQERQKKALGCQYYADSRVQDVPAKCLREFEEGHR